MGRFEEEEVENNNWISWTEMCTINNLVIINIMFQHKSIYKNTIVELLETKINDWLCDCARMQYEKCKRYQSKLRGITILVRAVINNRKE